MGLETGTYINSLNSAWPLAGDDRSTADDHLRIIKATIKATFPNITGAMTATHTELNILDGCTATAAELNLLSGITALASSDDIIDNFPAGTRMLFPQASAPTGWTQVVTYNDYALRLVSGTGAGTGGTTAFTTALVNSIAESSAVGDHQLTVAELPSHSHTATYQTPGGGGGYPGFDGSGDYYISGATSSTGGDGTHSHTLQLNVQYLDTVLASKN